MVQKSLPFSLSISFHGGRKEKGKVMGVQAVLQYRHYQHHIITASLVCPCSNSVSNIRTMIKESPTPPWAWRRRLLMISSTSNKISKRLLPTSAAAAAAENFSLQPPLDLTEDNVKKVLADSRLELAQLFDTSVGITGEVELAELDGPFVKICLRGKFWHKRSTVVARLGNYLKTRIPEILEVDIEDEKQLDDSPANF